MEPEQVAKKIANMADILAIMRMDLRGLKSQIPEKYTAEYKDVEESLMTAYCSMNFLYIFLSSE